MSIIVPVYNDEEYLNNCLDSLVGQTLAEIEIICVNDASTDHSLEILKKYAKRDERIRIVSYNTNKSASQARKDGVLESKGKYILFVDSDDELDCHACHDLVSEMEKKPVDILHFGSYILNNAHKDQRSIENIENLVAPYQGSLYGEDVFNACFVDRKYQFTLWNKMYSREVCKRAFENVENAFLPKAQDLYAFFIIAYYARSYRGIADKYYRYNYGCGITGQSGMSAESFWRFCHQALIPDKIASFLKRECLDTQYMDICNGIKQRLLKECIYNWANRLAEENQEKGYDYLVEFWGLENTVSALEEIFYQRRDFVAAKIIGANTNKIERRDVKTIGIYYHRISNGGVQRVISKQIPMLINMGYKVVLITDEPASVNDYELPDSVERVIIDNCFSIVAGNYYNRAVELSNILKTYKIDIIIDHAFASHILFWDLCVIRGNGIPVILCTHSIFSFYLVNKNFEFFMQIPWTYRMCNKVIALSSVDKKYYGICGLNSAYIPNPVEITVDRTRMTKFEQNNVLWVGRISEEKKPIELVRAFSKVVESVPDAKLYIVGDGVREYVDIVKKEISNLCLEDSVYLCGFRKDVDSFYEKAAICLSTSLYEGFSMTNVESKLFGVPSVIFEMPYLELLKDKKGYVFVRQGDYQEMARVVIRLLKDREYLTALGQEARESIEKFAKFDYCKAWKDVIDHIFDEWNSKIDTDEYKMLNVLFEHWRIGNAKNNMEVSAARNTIAKQNAEIERQKSEILALRNCHSYKIGHKLMFIPGLIKRCIIKR